MDIYDNEKKHQCCRGIELTLKTFFISRLICVMFNFLFIFSNRIRISAFLLLFEIPLFFGGKTEPSLTSAKYDIVHIIFGHIFSPEFQPVMQL